MRRTLDFQELELVERQLRLVLCEGVPPKNRPEKQDQIRDQTLQYHVLVLTM